MHAQTWLRLWHSEGGGRGPHEALHALPGDTALCHRFLVGLPVEVLGRSHGHECSRSVSFGAERSWLHLPFATGAEAPWCVGPQVTTDLMKLAKPDCIFMNCASHRANQGIIIIVILITCSI